MLDYLDSAQRKKLLQPKMTQLLLLIAILLSTTTITTPSTILFTTLGRSRYNFDIFQLPLTSTFESSAEFQLTDGISINFNGFFPSLTPSFLSKHLPLSSSNADSLLYITERDGISSIYLDLFPKHCTNFQLPARLQFPLITDRIAMHDRPSLTGEHLIYVATHNSSSAARHSWAAVYSTYLPTGYTRRLTPIGIADFSPAVSTSGAWTAVASYGERGWSGEVQELSTGIYVFRTKDGSRRRLLIEHGGWPCWGDDETLFFHRLSSDGWWSVYRAVVSVGDDDVTLVSVERITPAGFHAFTPAASAGAPGIVAVATRRGDSEYRHIELVDLNSESFSYVEVTRGFAPNRHHFNPFIAPDGSKIGYHRCRGSDNNGSPSLLLENIRSLDPEKFSLFRIDGSFPSFSPDGKWIAFVNLPGVYVVKSDGSGSPKEVFSGNAFPVVWDWKRKGVLYTSFGPEFSSESTGVDIISITLPSNDEDAEFDWNSQPLIKKLTSVKNNAFPSPSPDGKWIVFRSGRSGHKNLYIMDAVDGESAGIQRLTEGAWTDTMCNWSPDGEWIAFASDRHNPGGGSFAIYMIHPNGTGLRRVVHSGDGGRTNHPSFSPDSKTIVFTSDYAGISAEPISNPHHYQPYGEIFTINIDGSEITRLTHNSFEDGTPTWTPHTLKPYDVPEYLTGNERCSFQDCHWLNIEAQIRQVLPGKSC